MRIRQAVVTMVVAALFPALAWSQGTVNNGNATFSLQAIVTTATSDSTGADFRPEGGTSTDHAFEQWWWFRLAGGTRETPFNTSMTGFTQNYVGNTATLTFGQAGVFNAIMTYVITDGANTGEAQVLTSLQILNISGTSLAMSLFNYQDFDVAGTAGGDSAVLDSPNRMRITDGTVPLPAAFYDGAGATFFRAGAFAGSELGLSDTDVDNFANDGLPFGPGDFSGGFQWDINILPSDSFTASALLSIGPIASVPEPAMLVAAGSGFLMAGAGFLRWRKRNMRKAKAARAAKKSG